MTNPINRALTAFDEFIAAWLGPAAQRFGLKDFLEFKGIEGIVWLRNLGDPNTEMVKIKTSDFGLRR